MFSTYSVIQKFKDPSKVTLPGGTLVNANRNVIAVLQFVNDADPADVHMYYANGFDLTDAVIDTHARGVIATLNGQEAALAAITVNTVKTPDPPDPNLQALADAQAALGKASQAAIIKARNDPDEMAAYAAVNSAQDVVTASKTPPAKAVI